MPYLIYFTLHLLYSLVGLLGHLLLSWCWVCYCGVPLTTRFVRRLVCPWVSGWSSGIFCIFVACRKCTIAICAFARSVISFAAVCCYLLIIAFHYLGSDMWTVCDEALTSIALSYFVPRFFFSDVYIEYFPEFVYVCLIFWVVRIWSTVAHPCYPWCYLTKSDRVILLVLKGFCYLFDAFVRRYIFDDYL